MDVLLALALSATLSVANRTNATPSIAAAGDFVAVVWGASLASGSTNVYAAVSRDGGRTFGRPVRVNDIDGDARLGNEQPPRVALVPRPGREAAIVVVWTSKGTHGTKLLQARSDDDGRSFAHASVVPGSDAAGSRGWEAIAVEPKGRVDVVWLDHRGWEQASAGSMHHEHAAAGGGTHDGAAMAQQSKLYFAALDGSGEPHAVTGGVCYCCKTALAAGADGSLYAAWRHVYPGNMRDMAVALSHDGGRTFATPIRVSEDKWAFDGCPEDGPTVAVDAGHRVHLVWTTLVNGVAGSEPTLALFFATSANGRPFTPRERIPTEGIGRHPQITITADGSLAAAWDEAVNGTRQIAIAWISPGPDGRPQVTRRAAKPAMLGTHPVLAAVRDAVVAAWTSAAHAGSTIQVERVSNH